MDAITSPYSVAETPKANVRHLAWLDSLRALAALWVVAFHGAMTVGFSGESGVSRVVYHILTNGHFAVTAFIAISGFSLSLSPSRHGWRLRDGYRAFVVSRWVRIVPPYYASILLSLTLIATLIGHKTGTHWDVSVPVDVKGLLGHLLMVQNFIGVPQINHAYWSVSLEFQIYLLFGLVLWGMRWKGVPGSLLVAFLLAMGGVALHFALRPFALRGLVGNDQFTLATYVFVFGLGVCACRVSSGLRTAGRELSWAWCLPALALMGVATRVFSPAKHDLLFGIGASLLLLALSANERLSRPLCWAPLATLGTFSYSLYLTHAPMLQVVYVLGRVWRPQDSFGHAMLYLAVAMPTCVVVAYLFFVTCERPFFKLHRELRKGRAEAA